MTEEPGYFTFNTAMGWVAILGSVRGLLGITLPQKSAQEAAGHYPAPEISPGGPQAVGRGLEACYLVTGPV